MKQPLSLKVSGPIVLVDDTYGTYYFDGHVVKAFEIDENPRVPKRVHLHPESHKTGKPPSLLHNVFPAPTHVTISISGEPPSFLQTVFQAQVYIYDNEEKTSLRKLCVFLVNQPSTEAFDLFRVALDLGMNPHEEDVDGIPWVDKLVDGSLAHSQHVMLGLQRCRDFIDPVVEILDEARKLFRPDRFHRFPEKFRRSVHAFLLVNLRLRTARRPFLHKDTLMLVLHRLTKSYIEDEMEREQEFAVHCMLHSQNISSLVAICDRLGVKVNGTKKELVARVQNHGCEVDVLRDLVQEFGGLRQHELPIHLRRQRRKRKRKR